MGWLLLFVRFHDCALPTEMMMSRLYRLTFLPALTLALAAGCSSESEGEKGAPLLSLADGCQPLLGGYDCQLPYPSDFFRQADPAAPFGYRLVASGAGKLLNSDGSDGDVSAMLPFDGSSRIPTILGLLPSEVTAEGLPALLDNEDKSTSIESATLLLDTKTGKLVPHFTDLDGRTKDPTRQAIVLHPLVSLSPSTRYVVAIQNVKRPDGSPAPAAEGFRRLRDGVTGDPELLSHASRWEADVMSPLEELGVSRASLQLAWDFTTTTGELAMTDMLRVRQLTLAWLESNTPEIVVESVKDHESGEVWREIKGRVKGPLFLVAQDPGNPLFRDDSGQVVENGVASFPFTVQVPFSIRNSDEPGHALAYAHGFFGSRAEAEGTSARKIAERVEAVVFGIDWWGMSKDDVGTVIGMIANDPANTGAFTDRVHQAMVNWMTMTAAIREVFPTLPELQRPAGHPDEGKPFYDDSEVFFFGASQGHILGGTLAALDPNLSRIVLNVGGAGLSHMMARSRPFAPFMGFIAMSFKDMLDQQKFAASLQVPLDRIDPATYAPLVLSSPLPGSHPERRVLMQVGLGDVQVPNLASFLHARLLGIGQLEESTHPIFDVPQVSAPQSSAVSVFDFGVDLEEVYVRAAPAGKDNVVHEALRVAEPALEQMKRFFDDGSIIHPCEGPCVLK